MPHSEASSETAIALRTSQMAASMPQAPREEVVELVAEDEGRLVRDLGLHGDDSGQALTHQRLGHPGEGVTAAGAGSLAGVEHRQLHVAGVVQQGAEAVSRRPGAPCRPRARGRARPPGRLVEAAVPDEVEDVERRRAGPAAARSASPRSSTTSSSRPLLTRSPVVALSSSFSRSTASSGTSVGLEIMTSTRSGGTPGRRRHAPARRGPDDRRLL